MGNQLGSTVGVCCEPIHEEVQMDSAKIHRMQQKIDMVLVNDQREIKTDAKSLSSHQSNSQNFQTTAVTESEAKTRRLSTFNNRITLNLDEVNIEIAEQKNKMKVPFSVIELTFSERLKRVLNHHCQQILGRFMQDFSKVWQVTKKGHYVSIINKTFVSIFTERSFYEGEVINDGFENFIPNNSGLLVTEQGVYNGSFENGRANGKGIFIVAESNTAFKGQWQNGSFVSGIIENQIMRYSGQMENNCAEGVGKLIFKKNGFQFEGTFKGGLFQGQNCILKSPNYTYQGAFKQGKKWGLGSITEKQQKINIKIGSTKIKKYHPPSCTRGEWKDDDLIKILGQQ